ncbi:hypothetical protein [Dyella japonica]|uniref:Uncharacterized protein n=1 Tax=Dyella japonica TaxID=231455 RepID=A0ABV2JYZ9_9GAMM
MPEEKNDNPENFRIDTDDISVVDKAHPGSDECPICRNETWWVMQLPNQVIPVFPMLPIHAVGIDTPFNPNNGIKMVLLACQRCGYVRSHVLPIFEEYVKELRNGS